MMRILQGIVVTILVLNNSMLLAIPKTEICIQRIDHNFSIYRLDSCLYYSYLLAHRYRINADYANLTAVWYKISFFELERQQFSRAGAARQIAEQFNKKVKSKTCNPDINFYRDTYLALYFCKKENYADASIYLAKAIPNRNLLSTQLQYFL